MPLEAGQKFSHDACGYRPAEGGPACGNCHHFTGGGCQIVEDPIAADMLCDFHAPGQPQAEAAPEPSGVPVGMGMPRGARPF